MSVSDHALLDRWTNQRDAEAFAEIVSRHSAMVFSTCIRVLGNAADAQELTQECFARLAQGVPGGKQAWTSLGGWLHTVATRRALDWRKCEARRLRRDTEYAETAQPDSAIHDWDDVQGFVDDAIASLPDLLREPVVLHFLEGQNHRQIAKRLGVPRRTISSRIALGIKQVREHLTRRGVVVTSAALGVAIRIEAMPMTLVESLGRMALAGGTAAIPAAAPAAWNTAVIAGAVIAMKKSIVAAFVVILLAGGTFYWVRSRAGEKYIERVNAERVQLARTPEAAAPAQAPVEAPPYVPAPAGPSLTERIGTMLTPAAEPADSAAATGALEGRVTLSGKPLPGQMVMIMYGAGTQYAVRTSADGKFSLQKLPAGEITAYAMFADDTEGVHRVQRQETIRDGATTRLDIDFAGGGGVAGQITCDGMVPEDANVRVTSLPAEGGTENHLADADSTGHYSVIGIPSGAAQVLVTATAASGAHRMRRANVAVNAGTITRCDFDISGGSSVTGAVAGLVSGDRVQVVAVLDHTAVPAQMNVVWWFSLRDQLAARDQVSIDSTDYRLEGLDAGTYTIIALGGSGANARDVASWRVQHAVVQLDGSNTVELNFDLAGGVERPISVAGTVEGLEEGEKGALVFVSGDTEMPAQITDEFLSELQRSAASTVPVEDNQTFQVRGLDPGKYTVFALAGAHGVMSAQELRFTTGAVTVTENETATLDIEFPPNPGQGK
ncbi:MAG: sigma-70 family RNA polymerase sigma factor [Candidatus Hydrogenedentes bacterium]|nr:sigma-70 family RNA polymerase sigma factor [Candidatus Hydrogenedentota bacterium]